MQPRYYLIWRNKFLTTDAETIGDMIADLEAAVQQLRDMREAGVWLDGGAEDDYAYLLTEDEEVAHEYGFEEEVVDDDDDEDYDDEDEDYDDEDEDYDDDGDGDYDQYDEYEYDQDYG